MVAVFFQQTDLRQFGFNLAVRVLCRLDEGRNEPGGVDAEDTSL